MTNPEKVTPINPQPVMGLGARYFTDRDLFNDIMDKVFYRNWLLACHSSQVARPGDYLTITVRDTGEGMTGDTLDRMFEPFFTTKEVGQGSGLGLSQIYGFARQSRGVVEIESEVGRGTEVRLVLPRAAPGADVPPERRPPAGVSRAQSLPAGSLPPASRVYSAAAGRRAGSGPASPRLPPAAEAAPRAVERVK